MVLNLNPNGVGRHKIDLNKKNLSLSLFFWGDALDFSSGSWSELFVLKLTKVNIFKKLNFIFD